MVSTKMVAKTIPEIDNALKSFGGEMIKIEYLENCLRQLGLANDVARFCNSRLAELYASRLMFGPASKQMDNAAEKATTYKDKINFYLKEIFYLIRANDYLFIDKTLKKALLCCSNDKEKEIVRTNLKLGMMNYAQELEKKGKQSSSAQIYEKLLEMPIISETERKQLIGKLAEIYSRTGRIKEAMRYEQILKKPFEKPKDPETDVKKVSWHDLGIEFY